MITALFLMLASPMAPPLTKVDVIELNHVQTACGSTSFSQFIFWNRYTSGLHVVAYKVTNDWQTLRQGDYTSVLYPDGLLHRQIISRDFRETWTEFDAERLDRYQLPESERMGL